METQVLVYRGPVRWAGHALMAAVSVLSLFPLVWMVLNAFKPTDEILYFSLLPQNVTLQNFADALAMIPLPTMIVRSFASGVFQMVGQLCTGILAAYALTRWDFPGKKLFYGLFTVTWLVPFQATMLPNYVNLVQLGLRDTVAGIVLPNLASAFAILTLYQSFNAFPKTIFEAAQVDGANSLKTLLQVVLPNLKGPVASLGIILFINCWNEYFWPLLITRSIDKATVQIGLSMFLSSEGNLWGPLLAAAVLASLPILLLYMVLQKQIIDSFMKSGIK